MDQDIFFNTAKLSYSEQKAILRKAHSICERWWFDKLDCSESFARQRVEDISFEDAMDHFVEGALMIVIHRRPIIQLDEPHLEVGFRSMEMPIDYFLWIIVPMKHAADITDGITQLL
jgi:hypothetical protein